MKDTNKARFSVGLAVACLAAVWGNPLPLPKEHRLQTAELVKPADTAIDALIAVRTEIARLQAADPAGKIVLQPLPVQGPADHGRQASVLVDAQEQVDLGKLLQEILLIPLGQAAGDHQQAALSGFRELRHFEDRVDGFLLGGIDEPAGIDHEDIRFLRPGSEDETVLLQQAEGGLGVHPVLVAAEGNDAYGICHRYSPFLPDDFPAKI